MNIVLESMSFNEKMDPGFRRGDGVYLPLLAVCAVCFALITACTGTSDEQRIRALVSAVEQAAEARDTSDVMSLVAEDYSDGQGFDKEQLQNFLRAYFLTHPKIELFVRSGEVEFPARDLARVRVEVTMVGTRGAQEQSESLAGESEALRMELQLRHSEWRVTRVTRVDRVD